MRDKHHNQMTIKTRKAVNPFAGHCLWSELQDDLPEYAQRHLDAARAGEVEEAIGLCSAAPNEYRGLIALAAYWSGVANPAYREIMRAVWNHDHNQLMGATQDDRRLIRRMLRAAEFDHPFSGSVTAFRGTSSINLRTASKGLSWTLSRDVACWFAHRFDREDQQPLVLKARIDAADIIFWDNTRREQEIVFSQPVPAEPDPHPHTWIEAAKKLRQQRRRAQTTRLRRIKQRGLPNAKANAHVAVA